MRTAFSRFLDWFSNYFAHRKGLLPLVGILLIIVNLILNIVTTGFLVNTNLFLHLGVIIAILGFMVAWAL
jgi:hypothetical protein